MDLKRLSSLRELWAEFPGAERMYDADLSLAERLEGVRPYGEANRYPALLFAGALLQEQGSDPIEVPAWFVSLSLRATTRHMGGRVTRAKATGPMATNKLKEQALQRKLIHYSTVRLLMASKLTQKDAAKQVHYQLKSSGAWHTHDPKAVIRSYREVRKAALSQSNFAFVPYLPPDVIDFVEALVKSSTGELVA